MQEGQWIKSEESYCSAKAGNEKRTVQLTAISGVVPWSDLQLHLMKSLKALLQSKAVQVSDSSFQEVYHVDATPVEQTQGDLFIVSLADLLLWCIVFSAISLPFSRLPTQIGPYEYFFQNRIGKTAIGKY